jgi:acetoin utilization protein AcuC
VSARRAVLLWSEGYRSRSYGRNHPLAIPRVPLTVDLIGAYDALDAEEVMPTRMVRPEELAWYHDPAYIAAYAAAEAAGMVPLADRERYALGTLENPYFEGFYRTPANATGASIQGAEQVLAGRMAFNPAGGMHHARPGRAQGFCFLNDPVLAVLRLRQAGWRVLYVDIDAHHGDGVELAFRADPQVLTLSLHMHTGYAYPHAAGAFEDQGTSDGAWTTVNVPLPAGVHDAEYELAFDAAWYPLLERFAPDAVVLQAGADALFLDPLAKFKLTTQGWLAIVEKVIVSAPRHADGTPRLLVTGGGGYHLLGVARAWTGLWALLSGRDLPDSIPPEGAAAMRATGWDLDEDEAWFPGLFLSRFDAPLCLPLRDEIRRLAARIPRHRFFAHH